MTVARILSSRFVAFCTVGIAILPRCGRWSFSDPRPVIKLSREAPTGLADCTCRSQRAFVLESFSAENPVRGVGPGCAYRSMLSQREWCCSERFALKPFESFGVSAREKPKRRARDKKHVGHLHHRSQFRSGGYCCTREIRFSIFRGGAQVQPARWQGIQECARG